MPREVFTKVAADANGTWTRHTGDVTFATAGLTRGVLHDFSDGLTTVQVTPFGPPLAIDPAKISIADPADGTGLEVTLAADYVDAQGSAPTDLEYEVNDSGSWVSWGSAAPGTYLVPVSAAPLDTSADIQVRARNASATPGAELATPLTETPTNAAPSDLLGGRGSFDTSTGISLGPDWTIAGGVASRSGAISNSSYLSFGSVAGLVGGATYRMTGTMSNYVAGYIQFYMLGGATVSSSGHSGDGAFDLTLVAGASPTQVDIRAVSSGGNVQLSIDDVEVTYVSGP